MLKQFKAFIEDSEYYSRSVKTIHKEFKIGSHEMILFCVVCNYNLFKHEGEWYIGSKELHKAYYEDKLNGTNPFYQTW